MKILNYTIHINAPKEKVWKTMTDSKKYKEWTKVFSDNSSFVGEWKEGTHIKFIDANLGGTKAFLVEVKPFDYILARHVAIIRKDGTEDTESDVAKSWIDLTEEYTFKENKGETDLSIEMRSHEAYVNMFNENWPKALKILKKICEQSEKES
ncbi:MAG: SRPBCC domain-containing protein [Calditrichaceae bacterium]